MTHPKMTEAQLRSHGLSNGQSLLPEWHARLKLRAEGDKLRAEGDKLRAEGRKLQAEGDKLYAEGRKLHAEGDNLQAEGNKLYAEGNLLWAQAVIDRFGGRITMKWDGSTCRLGNGEVYTKEDEE